MRGIMTETFILFGEVKELTFLQGYLSRLRIRLGKKAEIYLGFNDASKE